MKDIILNKLKKASFLNFLESEEVQYLNDHVIYDKDDLLNVYIKNQKANMANVTLSNEENLANDVENILKNLHTTQVLRAQNTRFLNLDENIVQSIFYDFSIDDNKQKVFSIESAIVHGAIGVANQGVVGLKSSFLAPRLISLVVNKCIILLKKENIVANFFDAFKILRYENLDDTKNNIALLNENAKNTNNSQKLPLPTNIIFIAGPSRTADIELKTVFGVHGPQVIEIVLY